MGRLSDGYLVRTNESLYSVQSMANIRIRLIFDSSNTLVNRLGPSWNHTKTSNRRKHSLHKHHMPRKGLPIPSKATATDLTFSTAADTSDIRHHTATQFSSSNPSPAAKAVFGSDVIDMGKEFPGRKVLCDARTGSWLALDVYTGCGDRLAKGMGLMYNATMKLARGYLLHNHLRYADNFYSSLFLIREESEDDTRADRCK